MNEDLDMPASEEQNKGESAENSGTELSAMENIILERDDFRDQLLRKSAEFENYRRRTMKEKQDLIDFANEHLILKMLPVVDDLHTALEAAKQSTDPEGFLKGVEMIYAKAIKIFEEAGVSPIEIAPVTHSMLKCMKHLHICLRMMHQRGIYFMKFSVDIH